MPDPLADSPLTRLGVRAKPDGAQIVGDLKFALNQAAVMQVWERMEHNHHARYNVWPGHNRSCRKPGSIDDLLPGQTLARIFPFPGAADLESHMVEEIILENSDLLTIAATRAEVGVVPELLDGTNQERMAKAQAWGGVSQYYRRRHKRERRRFLRQLADIGQEYGHAIGFCGWKEQKKTVKRTINADMVTQLLASQVAQLMQGGQDQEQGEPQGPDADAMGDSSDQLAQQVSDELIYDPARADQLAQLLMDHDKDMSKGEAKRAALKLKTGETLEYFVAVVVNGGPDNRAFTPGLDIFYPIDTPRIQQARLVVMSQWHSVVELEAMVDDDGWGKTAVDKMIEAGPTLATNVGSLFGVPSWVLSRGVVGLDLQEQSRVDGSAHQYQSITVYYKASAMGGTPAVFRTVIAVRSASEGLVLKHECCEYATGEYPFIEYVREDSALCLWNSRGVGEIVFPEQDETRIQVNFRSDNSGFAIRPPMMVPVERKDLILKPGLIIPMKRQPGQQGIEKLDVAGDPRGSIEVEESALQRVNRYWQRGMGEYIDPVAKQNRQTCMVDDWLACVEEFERMQFSCIQEFAGDAVKSLANDGNQTLTEINGDEIRGEFNVTAEFDSSTLDPESVKQKIEMFQKFILPMDAQGQVNREPALNMACAMVFPGSNGRLIKPGDQAQNEEMADVLRIWNNMLNGIEDKYVVGKNHAFREKMFIALSQQQAMDEKGQPIPNGDTGEAIPGRGPRIIMENPDVAALVQKRIKFEHMQQQQQDVNPTIGRLGIDPEQSQAQP